MKSTMFFFKNTFAVLVLILCFQQSYGQLQINSVTPARNALNVPTDANISVEFSAAINGGTLTTQNIRVYGSQTGFYTGTFGGHGTNTITFDPSQNFKNGETVTLSFTTALRGTGNEFFTATQHYQFTVRAGFGHGLFSKQLSIGVGAGPQTVVSADIDKDGDVDVVSANYSGNTISVLKNNGNGILSNKTDYTGTNQPIFSQAADVDNDGDMDIIASHSAGFNISVFKNNGNGTFASKVDYPTGMGATSVYAADLDGDGDIDLGVACSHTSVNYLSIFRNNGDGTFAGKVDYRVEGTNGAFSVFGADIDRDGDIDLAVVNRGGNTVSVFRNHGNGTFAPRTEYSTNSMPSGVYFNDFDADGDADMAVCNYGSSTLSIFTNQGNGTFNTKADYTIGTGVWSIYGLDVEGDGDIDLVGSNADRSVVSILRNNGDATFGTSTSFAAEGYTIYTSPLDCDGDGDMDLAVANFSANTVSILKNIQAINVQQNTTPIPATTGTYNFGAITTGTTITQTFTINNPDPNFVPNISSIAVSGVNAAAFVTSNLSNANITATGSVTFDVTFTGSSVGNNSAFITINSTSFPSQYAFTLFATVQPSLQFSTTSFVEAAANNGSIGNFMTVTLTGDTFTGINGEDLAANGRVNISNLPAGLGFTAIKLSNTQVGITLTNQAIAHESANSIPNNGTVVVTFNPTANTSGVALIGNGQSVGIQFNNAPSLQFSTTSFVEAAANNGSIGNFMTVTLTGDTFAGANGTNLANNGVTISNLPAGLGFTAIIISPTQVGITLTGQATAHENANSIPNNGVVITFTSTATTTGNTATPLNNNFPVSIFFENAPPPYRLINSTVTGCENSLFSPCLEITGTGTGIIGYDINMNHPSFLEFTGNFTIGNAVVTTPSVLFNTATPNVLKISLSLPDANGRINGAGMIICPEFRVKAGGATAGTYFISGDLIESYLTTSVDLAFATGTVTVTESRNFGGRLIYDNDALRPVGGSLSSAYTTNVAACAFTSSSVVLSVDANGNFTGMMPMTQNALRITRNIPNANSVMSVINAMDANEVARIRFQEFTPTPWQLVKADVSGDRRVTAGDRTLIVRRSASIIDQFGNNVPDWRVISDATMNSTAFNSMNMDNVNLYDNSCVDYSAFNFCTALGNQTYHMVLMGDVNGSWATTDAANARTEANSEILIDLANAVQTETGYSIPVSYKLSGVLQGFDMEARYTNSDLLVEKVSLQDVMKANTTETAVNTSKNIFAISSSILKGIDTQATIFNLEVTGKKLSAESFGTMQGFLNGKPAQIRFTESAAITTELVDPASSIMVYPNPVTEGKLNIVAKEMKGTDVKIRIMNLFGQEVYRKEVSQFGGQSDVDVDLIKGIYIVEIMNNNIRVTKKVQVATK